MERLPTDQDWAYIAGLIDADGCFYMQKRRVHYRTIFQFVNTNKEVCDWLAKVLKINSNRIKPLDYEKNRKALYQISLWSRERLKIAIQKMLPYLIIKKRRAELILEYLSLHNWRQGMRDPLLPREEEIYKELKQLNRVGVNHN